MRIPGTIKRLLRRGRKLLKQVEAARGGKASEPGPAAKEAAATKTATAEAKSEAEPVQSPADDDGRVRLDYKDRTVVFEPFGGSIERILRSGVFYEAKFLQYIESLNLSGAYIDAGAYVGTHTLFFALFCPSTTVYSFEPRQRCFDLLSTNIKANEVSDKIVVHKLGLSDQEETVTVSLDRKDEVFRCSSLDAVIDDSVAVIKVDVEGMEPKVMEGARKILERDKPIVFLEAQTDAEFESNKALMATFGYKATGKVFNATPTHEYVPIKD